jgi:ClpP class serine protease
VTTQEEPRARYVKPGEMLAMDPSRIHRGPHGFFWLFGEGPKPNERRGDVAIVHVRGELEHHKRDYECAESYEGLVEKFAAALTGADAVRAHEAAARQANYGGLPDDYQPLDAIPPRKVLLCIDSPGGVVAGLNETQATLLRMKREAKVPVEVYVNEMAASAAYALACVGDRIVCPRSAILGSVGVISTMISQARKNEKDGYDVELITSGARKADGHLHAPIRAAAVAVERGRVMKLAADFWAMVAKSRRIPVAKIRSFEAAIFLGPDAVKAGLADAVGGIESVLTTEHDDAPAGAKMKSGGNQTDRRVDRSQSAMSPSQPSQLKVSTMKLSAKLISLMAAMATEADPTKRAATAATIAKKSALLAAKAEGGDDDPDDEDDSDEDESKASKAAEKAEKAKKAAEAAKHRAKKAEYLKKAEEAEEAAKMAEEDEEEEESEEEEAKAALAAVQALTGMRGKAALGALQSLANVSATIAKDVAELKRTNEAAAKATLIDGARKAGQITKAEATWLREQPGATAEGFVAMRAKAGLVLTDEDSLVKPKHVEPGTAAALPAETLAMIDSAVNVWQGDKKAYRESLVKAHIDAHAKQVSAALNGAGRY